MVEETKDHLSQQLAMPIRGNPLWIAEFGGYTLGKVVQDVLSARECLSPDDCRSSPVPR